MTEIAVEDTKNLNKELWDAVASGDLAASRSAHSRGACPNLFYNGRKIIPFDEYIQKDRSSDGNYIYVGETEPHKVRAGVTTLMVATQSNALPLMKWLLDVGCNANDSQPDLYEYGDGYGFGGLTALACATSREAVELLLSRGASAKVQYTPPQYEAGLKERSLLMEHMVLRSGPDREAIIRSLVQHGADVNEAGYPYHGSGQDEGRHYVLQDAPTSLWPQVVTSGNVEWARELLEDYGADPNWPTVRAVENFGLGATVLQISILNEDIDMCRLLLEKGADPLLPEQVWIDLEELDNCGMEVEDLFFLDEEKANQYWEGATYEEKRALPRPSWAFFKKSIVAPATEKLATPLSVALGTGNTGIMELLEKYAGAAAMKEDCSERASVPVLMKWK